MTGRLLEETRAMNDRSTLGVLRAKNQAADPGMADRPSAHRAWLQRDHQGQPGQSVIANPFGSRPDRQDFGVRRWIIARNRRVAGPGNNLTRGRIEHDSPYRRLATCGCGLRLGQCSVHGG